MVKRENLLFQLAWGIKSHTIGPSRVGKEIDRCSQENVDRYTTWIPTSTIPPPFVFATNQTYNQNVTTQIPPSSSTVAFANVNELQMNIMNLIHQQLDQCSKIKRRFKWKLQRRQNLHMVTSETPIRRLQQMLFPFQQCCRETEANIQVIMTKALVADHHHVGTSKIYHHLTAVVEALCLLVVVIEGTKRIPLCDIVHITNEACSQGGSQNFPSHTLSRNHQSY